MHDVLKRVWNRVQWRYTIYAAYPSEFLKVSPERGACKIMHTKKSRSIPPPKGPNPDPVSRPTKDTRELGGKSGRRHPEVVELLQGSERGQMR